MANVAERAATGADVAHDHEGCGAAGEAFAEVRAGRFFADTVQLVLAQQALDAVDFRRNRDAHADPVGFLRQFGGRDDLDRDACNLLGAAQLDAGFNLGTRGRALGHVERRDHGLHCISSHISRFRP